MNPKTSLTYWFPLIETAGLPVPKTEIVSLSEEMGRDLYIQAIDGGGLPGAKQAAELIRAAADRIGYPCFLRTSHTSAKHSFDKTCRLTSVDSVLEHMEEIVRYGEMASFIGLPMSQWAVREWLPGREYFKCREYGNMPARREFRCFAQDGTFLCVHPYWPTEAIRDGRPDSETWEALLSEMNAMDEATERQIATLACVASGICKGAWSVDCLDVNGKWYITDMAMADESFHWEGCEVAAEMGWSDQ